MATVLCLGLLLFSPFALAQNLPQNLPEKSGDRDWNSQIQQMSLFLTQGISDYQLGPGDLIEIKVFGVDDFNQTVRISSSGSISLPFLGKIVVAGLTGAQLEETLTQLMNDNKLIRDPQVSVFVKEFRSQPVYVLGAVNNPGQYMISQQLNLIDVIAMAGGLDLTRADDYALFHRRTGDSPEAGNGSSHSARSAAGGTSEPIKIDLKDLLENGNLALNFPVQGGDVIHVPEREVELFYVIGEVGRPGAYQMPTKEERVLVSQALAWAGGPQTTAKMSKGILVRYDERGGRQELAVDFGAILKGEKPDFPVEPQDVIFIPGSKFKTIGYGLLGIVPGTISGTLVYGPIRR